MIFTAYIKQEIGIRLIKEHKFHPTRRWRFDYAFPELNIAIEVEGGVFTQGRHTRGKGFIADMEKYNTATAMGWKVLRTTPDKLLTQQTVDYIKECIEYHKLQRHG